MTLIFYAPAHTPIVYQDCLDCDGTGIGKGPDPNTSRCAYCKGRGYFSHRVSLDCECAECVEFREGGE